MRNNRKSLCEVESGVVFLLQFGKRVTANIEFHSPIFELV